MADASPTHAPCTLCGHAASLLFRARDRNLRVDARMFAYYRCPRCACVFLAEPPPDLGRYYPAAYFPLLESVAELERSFEGERYKLDLLSASTGPGRLVEVGPGAGAFAWAAARAGFDVNTIEMDDRNCEHLRQRIGVGAVQSAHPEDALAQLPPSRAIAMWHSLEHLPRPWAALRSAAGNLEPGGVLVLAVPNPDAVGFRLLRRRWPHVDAPRHLTLIPARTLVGFLAGLGLQCASLSASDAGSRHWNRFGWAFAITSASAPRPRRLVAWIAGSAVAKALAPIEQRHLGGATYSAVFRKTAAPA